jgi:multiple sugar transport system ATP-binding protein
MAEIRLVDVTKKFGENIAVDHIDLTARDKEFVVLVGPSGCGKTTTLRMIAGLEEITEGEIYIGERSIICRPKIGILPWSFKITPFIRICRYIKIWHLA